MKIAVIIDLWDPVTGGSQTHVCEIAHRLVREHDCEIDIFTRALLYDSNVYNSDESLLDGRLRIIRVGPATHLANTWGRVATLWTIAWRVALENKKRDYDLIHAHSILGGAIGKLAAYFTKNPLLFTVHGSPNIDGGRKNFDYYAEKFILTKLKYHKVISVGKSYLSHKNVNSDIEIIPNGVDIKKFDALSPVGKADFFKIIFVGRLDWVKGIDTLIEALKILKGKKSGILSEKKLQVHLIGYGFDAEKYKTMARASCVDDIILFRGKIRGEALIKEYKSSHLFILPSLCEGQPLTILEAMAAGLPLLTTFAADNAEIVSTEEGWKIESKNADQLAAKMEEVMSLPEETLEEMGKKAHQTATSNYSWENVISELFRIYSEGMTPN